VTLAGWRDDVAACLASVTVFCLPSHLEGLCTSLLDASLFDLPLIACDTGGVPDIVRGGETGWLAPPRDPKALAAALSDALARPEEAKRRAAAARAQTEERFTLQGTAEKTLALWRRLVAEGAV
jgi:glycosyltransferase involved in cell wall biosynthesis